MRPVFMVPMRGIFSRTQAGLIPFSQPASSAHERNFRTVGAITILPLCYHDPRPSVVRRSPQHLLTDDGSALSCATGFPNRTREGVIRMNRHNFPRGRYSVNRRLSNMARRFACFPQPFNARRLRPGVLRATNLRFPLPEPRDLSNPSAHHLGRRAGGYQSLSGVAAP